MLHPDEVRIEGPQRAPTLGGHGTDEQVEQSESLPGFTGGRDPAIDPTPSFAFRIEDRQRRKHASKSSAIGSAGAGENLEEDRHRKCNPVLIEKH